MKQNRNRRTDTENKQGVDGGEVWAKQVKEIKKRNFVKKQISPKHVMYSRGNIVNNIVITLYGDEYQTDHND